MEGPVGPAKVEDDVEVEMMMDFVELDKMEVEEIDCWLDDVDV